MTRTENDLNSPRVNRGGSWGSVEPSWVRSAYCDTGEHALRRRYIGFRTALPGRMKR